MVGIASTVITLAGLDEMLGINSAVLAPVRAGLQPLMNNLPFAGNHFAEGLMQIAGSQILGTMANKAGINKPLLRIRKGIVLRAL